jgi:methanogenic corrinoid protein MtbC1
MHEHGAPVETLYLDLLAPTARCLGEMWCQDTCHFADVTMGLSKLHRLLNELGPTFRREGDAEIQGRHILLAPVPGEQHSFGLTMVAEFFRRASWDVSDQPGIPANADLVQLVRAERFDIVGLSIASEIHLDGLVHGIRALRRASKQPSLGILVGGPLFVQYPELVARVGADATAIDAGQAPVQAEGLLQLLAGHS